MVRHKRPQKNVPESWPVTRRWLAAGTLAIYSAVGCQIVTAAQLIGKGAPSAAVPPSPLPARRFDIPAGPLGEAATQFQNLTGIAVTFRKEGITQLSSPGVSAFTTPDKALDLLTSGTSVQWRFTSDKSVAFDIGTVTESVSVNDTVAALSTSSAKFSEPLRDTPQTINVVSQQTMQEQETTTLRDALRNVAGISIAAGEGGAQGDSLTIRGFSARNDLYVDGMRDFGSYYRDPFYL